LDAARNVRALLRPAQPGRNQRLHLPLPEVEGVPIRPVGETCVAYSEDPDDVWYKRA
jgi:hypothetical protein